MEMRRNANKNVERYNHNERPSRMHEFHKNHTGLTLSFAHQSYMIMRQIYLFILFYFWHIYVMPMMFIGKGNRKKRKKEKNLKKKV